MKGGENVTKVYCGKCSAQVMEVKQEVGYVEIGPMREDTLDRLFGRNYCICKRRRENEHLRERNAAISEKGACLLSGIPRDDWTARLVSIADRTEGTYANCTRAPEEAASRVQ